MGYVGQTTLQYVTFVKRGGVEAMRAAFNGHTDPTVASAKVDIDFTSDEFNIPAVIVGFSGTTINNAGVGHFEWFPYPLDAPVGDPDTQYLRYQHRIYKGTLKFTIYAYTSADRDILADATVEVMSNDEVSLPGQAFLQRFYNELPNTPYGLWHFVTLNTDQVDPVAESVSTPPWSSEDRLVYQTGYTVPLMGEFYSYTPPEPLAFGPVAEVDVYPWIPDIDPEPDEVGSDAYYKFKGQSKTQKDI